MRGLGTGGVLHLHPPGSFHPKTHVTVPAETYYIFTAFVKIPVFGCDVFAIVENLNHGLLCMGIETSSLAFRDGVEAIGLITCIFVVIVTQACFLSRAVYYPLTHS